MANINYLNNLEIEKTEFKKDINLKTKEIIINEDKNLVISEAINYNIIIEKNSNLNIRISSNKPIMSNINITLKKNVTVNLFEFTISKSSFIEKNIILENNSKLSYSQIILSNRLNKTEVELKENSSYNLISSFKIDNEESYIYNSAINKDRNSKANLEINGVSLNGASVINDGLIRIEKLAVKSEGYQKLNNLILDDKSKIISEPILEILNSDVKCSHGASISQIKDDILSYANSRGLSKLDATNLVIQGFFNKSLEKLNEDNTKQVILKDEMEKILKI